MSKPQISFVIPAFNEEQEIARTLKAISFSTKDLNIEIIVVDNLSTDQTATICRNHGAQVISSDAKTIGAVRNHGAEHAKGKFLAFIDADVALDPNWGNSFAEALSKNKKLETGVFGSKCSTPFSDYISRGWFSKIRSPFSGYVNSGHLIISKSSFEEIGGFQPDLSTSEDVDFCARAERIGLPILEVSSLVAFHYGFPTNVVSFIKREAWHGYQDTSSFNNLKRSKTALLSLTTTVTFTLLMALGILLHNPILISLSIFSLFIFSFIFYYFKVNSLKHAIRYWPIATFYFIGRSISTFMQIIKIPPKSPRIASQDH
ncbi:MAG: glycosyltransferase [Rickettsiales bacterium]